MGRGLSGMGWGTVWATLYDVVIAVHNDGVPGARMN